MHLTDAGLNLLGGAGVIRSMARRTICCLTICIIHIILIEIIQIAFSNVATLWQSIPPYEPIPAIQVKAPDAHGTTDVCGS